MTADADSYFEQLAKSLKVMTDSSPDIVLYNAGVDVYPRLTEVQVRERDNVVAAHIRGLGCRTVIVMAGGYGNYETIASMHVATIEAFAGASPIGS